jgi:hypothetical protein
MHVSSSAYACTSLSLPLPPNTQHSAETSSCATLDFSQPFSSVAGQCSSAPPPHPRPPEKKGNAPEPPPTRLSLSFASALLPPLAALRFDATCACRAVSKETYYRGKRDLLNLPHWQRFDLILHPLPRDNTDFTDFTNWQRFDLILQPLPRDNTDATDFTDWQRFDLILQPLPRDNTDFTDFTNWERFDLIHLQSQCPSIFTM